jgi:hypothetical protein
MRQLVGMRSSRRMLLDSTEARGVVLHFVPEYRRAGEAKRMQDLLLYLACADSNIE